MNTAIYSVAAFTADVYKRQISGCVEPDISDDFGIQKDNELQSKLSAPAADAVMTKPPAAEPGKKKVKSDKDELAKEVEKVSEQIAINDAENAIQQKPYVFPAVDLSLIHI